MLEVFRNLKTLFSSGWLHTRCETWRHGPMKQCFGAWVLWGAVGEGRVSQAMGLSQHCDVLWCGTGLQGLVVGLLEKKWRWDHGDVACYSFVYMGKSCAVWFGPICPIAVARFICFFQFSCKVSSNKKIQLFNCTYFFHLFECFCLYNILASHRKPFPYCPHGRSFLLKCSCATLLQL